MKILSQIENFVKNGNSVKNFSRNNFSQKSHRQYLEIPEVGVFENLQKSLKSLIESRFLKRLFLQNWDIVGRRNGCLKRKILNVDLD